MIIDKQKLLSIKSCSFWNQYIRNISVGISGVNIYYEEIYTRGNGYEIVYSDKPIFQFWFRFHLFQYLTKIMYTIRAVCVIVIWYLGRFFQIWNNFNPGMGLK